MNIPEKTEPFVKPSINLQVSLAKRGYVALRNYNTPYIYIHKKKDWDSYGKDEPVAKLHESELTDKTPEQILWLILDKIIV